MNINKICKVLKIKPSSFFIFIFLSAVMLFSVYPLLSPQLNSGADLQYHLLRIEGIKESLLHGDVLALIHPNILNGYGYGNGLFYPQVLLYFPAILRIIGLGPTNSYKIFIIFISMLTCITSCFSSKYIFC